MCGGGGGGGGGGLNYGYWIKDKGLKLVIKELKERLVATSSKLRRHEARTEQYVQNRITRRSCSKGRKRRIEVMT